MPDIPPEVHVAYQKAFWDRMKSFGYGYSDPVWHSLNAALEAAAPLLAEAWGVTERERQSERLYAEHAQAMRELKEDGWHAGTEEEGT